MLKSPYFSRGLPRAGILILGRFIRTKHRDVWKLISRTLLRGNHVVYIGHRFITEILVEGRHGFQKIRWYCWRMMLWLICDVARYVMEELWSLYISLIEQLCRVNVVYVIVHLSNIMQWSNRRNNESTNFPCPDEQYKIKHAAKDFSARDWSMAKSQAIPIPDYLLRIKN